MTWADQVITVACVLTVAGLGVGLIADRRENHRGEDAPSTAVRPEDIAHIAAALGEPVDAVDIVWCANCKGRVSCAVHPDGSRHCWTCRTYTPAA